MSRTSILPLFLMCVLACTPGPDEPPAQLQKQSPVKPASGEHPDIDSDNLLNVARGAAVVSRTGEYDLASSALHAIDGMSYTTWVTPPNRVDQTLVFSLGAPSRIDRLGVTATLPGKQRPDIRFSASLDGKTWREVFTMRPVAQRDPQITAVTPFEARYLRVETIGPGMSSMKVTSFHALGTEIGQPEVHSFGGCWTIDNEPARIEQDGARVRGAIGGENPTYIDGVMEGRLANVMWTRGFQWGYAVLTLTADGRNLSAVAFHTNPRTGHVGQAWFGERCASVPELRIAPPPLFLARANHWSVENASAPHIANIVHSSPGMRFRITAYEHREATAEANRRRVQARLASLRDALRQAGADLDRVELVPAAKPLDDTELHSAVQKILWSRMDFTVIQ